MHAYMHIQKKHHVSKNYWYSNTIKVKRKRGIISAANHKWKDIAVLIYDNANKTTKLEKQYQNETNECLKQVLFNTPKLEWIN